MNIGLNKNENNSFGLCGRVLCSSCLSGYGKLCIIIAFCFFLINCESLREILTTVSGKVYADNCKVVIAVKGDLDLFYYLNNISGIDEESLRDPELIRGFDIGIGQDSLYNVTMLSFGQTYFFAVVDDGLVMDELDTLDHIGFYGQIDTIYVPAPFDTTVIYSIPTNMNIEEGIDENGIDIKNFVDYKCFKSIMNP